MGQLGFQARQQIVVRCIIRALKCRQKSQFISGSVAFEHQTAQSQQGSAIVPPMID
jgi:hypothetical protein